MNRGWIFPVFKPSGNFPVYTLKHRIRPAFAGIKNTGRSPGDVVGHLKKISRLDPVLADMTFFRIGDILPSSFFSDSLRHYRSRP